MKSIHFILLGICLSMILGCNRHRRTACDYLELGKSHYVLYDKKLILEAENSMSNKKEFLKLIFLNNPYNLNENNIVLFYINQNLVYSGRYQPFIDLKGDPDIIFSKRNRVNMHMKVLTDTTKNTVWIHDFVSKMTFVWNENYKVIYCCFCPTNEFVERVFFIPHEEISF